MDGFEPAIEMLRCKIGKCTKQIEALRGLEVGNESFINGLEDRRKLHEDQLYRLLDGRANIMFPARLIGRDGLRLASKPSRRLPHLSPPRHEITPDEIRHTPQPVTILAQSHPKSASSQPASPLIFNIGQSCAATRMG